jgi:glyoxalase family protein
MITRFGENVIPFSDPDGTRLTLAAQRGIEAEPAWSTGEIPSEHAIRGLHSVNLLVERPEPTAAILTDVLGFSATHREGATQRYRVPDTRAASIVDIRAVGGLPRGHQGAGSVHHVAFRAADDADQTEMVRKLADTHSVRTTEQKDRNYFRSVYFREPGHVLFEIATDPPGFAVDEPVANLGEALKLPLFWKISARKSKRRSLNSARHGEVRQMAADLSYRHIFEPAA